MRRIYVILVTMLSIHAGAVDKWGVYSEKTNLGKDLSCWVCTRATAGGAACLGNTLIPDTEWDTREQAGSSACVLKRNGKCLEVQNYKCGSADKTQKDKGSQKPQH